jgi:hypothetical protein
MDRVICPHCGYTVGLGMAAEMGNCPSCEVPLVLTCEFRALSQEDLEALSEPGKPVRAPA